MSHARMGASLLLALAVVWLGGCRAGPTIDARDLQPLVDGDGQARSLAFASPQQREVVAMADFPPGLPWYAERNDHPPSVEAGVEPATFERSFTRTVDRQRVIRGRVFDAYRETTYRERARETWR